MTNIVTDAREAMASLAEPLREQLKTLDREIEETAVRLVILRNTRRDVANAIRLIDPNAVPTKKKVVNPKGSSVSPETVEAVREFIFDHKAELNTNGGFNTTTLMNLGLDGFARQTIVIAMRKLHEAGALTFDHTGVAGSKFYRTVG